MYVIQDAKEDWKELHEKEDKQGPHGTNGHCASDTSVLCELWREKLTELNNLDFLGRLQKVDSYPAEDV